MLTIGFSQTLPRMSAHSTSSLHHPKLDEIFDPHRTSSTLHCIFVGTFQDRSQTLLTLSDDGKMFAQGTAVSSDGSLSPNHANYYCCTCRTNGKCQNGTPSSEKFKIFLADLADLFGNKPAKLR